MCSSYGTRTCLALGYISRYVSNLPSLWFAELIVSQDCIRYGHGSLWAAGMPWKLIDAAISNDFKYSVASDDKKAWTKTTGRNWDNTADPLDTKVKCPSCVTKIQVPWTTCGLPQNYSGDR